MGFRQTARGCVISALESLCLDIDALSVLILQMRNGSDLDRSSPKHLLRCLTGRRAEEK